jgi:hypothetical protein
MLGEMRWRIELLALPICAKYSVRPTRLVWAPALCCWSIRLVGHIFDAPRGAAQHHIIALLPK